MTYRTVSCIAQKVIFAFICLTLVIDKSCAEVTIEPASENAVQQHELTSMPLMLSQFAHGFNRQLPSNSVDGENRLVTVSVNEGQGITLTQGNVSQHLLKGNFSLAYADTVTVSVSTEDADSSKATHHALILTAFNHDTQAITHVEVSPETLKKKASVNILTDGSEALCAQSFFQPETQPGTLQETHIVNIDAKGIFHQYLVRDNVAVSLRSFAIGPGVKSCALNKDATTVYLADENAGVWEIDTNIESEVARTLLFHQPGIAVEGIDTIDIPQGNTITELLAWVSPDKSGFWLKSPCNVNYIDVKWLNNQQKAAIKPENIALALTQNANEPSLSIVVDDDDSDAFFTASVPLTTLYRLCPIASANEPTSLKVMRVTPDRETQPVNHFGDAADDPAIWVNQREPENSRILGTDKKGALNNYTLSGELVQSLAIGRVNNVDVGLNVKRLALSQTESSRIDIAVASNRSQNSLSVMLIDSDGLLEHRGEISTGLNDIYGMCLFVVDGTAHVIANDTSGQFEHHVLTFSESAAVRATLTQTFALPSQPEGCVVDPKTLTAYLGEEGVGIWMLDVSTTRSTPRLVAPINAPVEADIEGLALYDVDGIRYLIASSQGNNRYAIYDTTALPGANARTSTLSFVGLIQIDADLDNRIDGVSETDGLEASNVNFGGIFSEGLWVVQDGRNVMPSETQNFKFVSGSKLSEAIRTLRENLPSGQK
ncbi:hypothetical protein D210916BOD24_17810 [Alteromonas sp. D210916BOD_24]|uniref:phytase n=1 Tax=Alteromonas sp. D210916BOD_24 TaxID=3157618 RepID=UPI00399C699D